MFKFNKVGSLIQKPEEMPSPGPYYTSVVEMKSVKDFPYDYALYFSTDHNKGLGGIWLYLCSGDPLNKENWVSYNEAVSKGKFDYLNDKPRENPIFIETVQGTGHTETPHVNIVEDKVYMTYHKDGTGHSQATLLAIATDGVNFTRINGDQDSIVLNYDVNVDPGNGHTGYFRWGNNPFSGISFKYVGYSLHGGGDQYYSAMWGSNDVIDWERLQILVPTEGLALDNKDHMIIWHEMDVNSIRKISDDEYVAICGVGNRASGKAARIVELYEIYLGADGCTLKRNSRKVLGVDSSGKDSEELSSPITLNFDNEVSLLYVGASSAGEINTIMGAKGVCDSSCELPKEIPEESRRQHFYE